jgi:hypothetical protein
MLKESLAGKHLGWQIMGKSKKRSRISIKMDLYELVFRIHIQLNGLKNMFNGNPYYEQSTDFRLYHNLVR